MVVNFDVLLIVQVGKEYIPSVLISNSDISSFNKEVVNVGKEITSTLNKSNS